MAACLRFLLLPCVLAKGESTLATGVATAEAGAVA